MHLRLHLSLAALVALATCFSLLLDPPSLRAAGNPLEQIFGPKKYENPPKKKKKKTSTSTKKSSGADDAEKPPTTKTSATKKKGTAAAEEKSPKAATNKKKKSGDTSSSSAGKSGVASNRKKTMSVNAEEVIPAPTPAPTPRTKSAGTSAPEIAAAPEKDGEGMTSSIASEELKEFAAQPDRIKQLIESCLALTRRNLTYTYGSADPANGGMDCSGFIYFTLRDAGFPDTPRQANEQYVWVRKKSSFQAVVSRKSDTFEINDLRPGDLMFWTGTYDVDRDPPITHTMIYLGTSKKTGQRVMVGSSDGRTYLGQKRNGVSVFDFHVATASRKDGNVPSTRTPDFVGYGAIPGMR
jgi:cell wall-associated NlpC family hydrolase